ncbi:hypothetical protein [Actinomadura sp. NPDC000929]|uniref:hypothetical protein n=1 Tax=Actinomadura sp. NPDC000929 TaxID=3154517 RepID=UPI00339AC64F
MTNGDMRYGQCGACGAGEVFQGEYVAQSGLRKTGGGSFGGRQPTFDAYICAACGNTQLHVRLDSKMSSHIRRHLQWIPPALDTR